MKLLTTVSRAAVAASLALSFASIAQANETEAGRSVGNTFTLDYTVDGVTQGTITNDGSVSAGTGEPDPVYVQGASSGTSAPVLFTVDRLIDLSLTAVSANPVVPPNAEDRILEFTLTNDGNDNQSYSFWIDELTSDQFDVTGIEVTYSKTAYNLNPQVESGQSGTDTDTTDDCEGALTNEPITLLAALGDPASTGGVDNFSCSIPPDGTLTIRISGDIPASLTDGDVSSNFLYAQTRDPIAWIFETATLTEGALTTDDSDGTNTVTSTAENVFADGDGDAGVGTDVDNDGIMSIGGTYTVRDADLSAAKTVTIWDTAATDTECSAMDMTVTAPTDQYPVPGACVQYVITVTNSSQSADSDADGITLVDVLPLDLEFVSATATGFDTAGTLTYKKNGGATDCDGTEGSSTAPTENCTIELDGASLDGTDGADNVATLEIRALVR